MPLQGDHCPGNQGTLSKIKGSKIAREKSGTLRERSESQLF